MRVQLVTVPAEGQDSDEEFSHGLEFEMPALPQAGDCILISRPGQTGSSHFIVRRTLWSLDHPDEGSPPHVGRHVVGTTNAVMIECEYVIGPYASEEHKFAAASAIKKSS